MKEKRREGGITFTELSFDAITIIGNKISDDLFYLFAHTPLPLGNIHNSGQKLSSVEVLMISK